MIAAAAVAAAVVFSLAVIRWTTRQTIAAAREWIAAAHELAADEPTNATPEQLARLAPALAAIDHHHDQERRAAEADPAAAADLAAELRRRAADAHQEDAA